MPELTPKERLQPSLLDRLTDDDPRKKEESRDDRVFSSRRLKEIVRRDLSWLLNTTDLAACRDLEPYPDIKSSVLNFGVPDLAGVALSDKDLVEFERLLREAIINFEPRIIKDTLKVRLSANVSEMNATALLFDIEGDLWGQPLPQQLYLRTRLDLEMSEFVVEAQNSNIISASCSSSATWAASSLPTSRRLRAVWVWMQCSVQTRTWNGFSRVLLFWPRVFS
jgi:type VI secretion system protein ImpF